MIPVNQIDYLFYILLGVRVMHDYLKSIKSYLGRLLKCFYDLQILTMT